MLMSSIAGLETSLGPVLCRTYQPGVDFKRQAGTDAVIMQLLHHTFTQTLPRLTVN